MGSSQGQLRGVQLPHLLRHRSPPAVAMLQPVLSSSGIGAHARSLFPAPAGLRAAVAGPLVIFELVRCELLRMPRRISLWTTKGVGGSLPPCGGRVLAPHSENTLSDVPPFSTDTSGDSQLQSLPRSSLSVAIVLRRRRLACQCSSTRGTRAAALLRVGNFISSFPAGIAPSASEWIIRAPSYEPLKTDSGPSTTSSPGYPSL